jgi:hypothetical protein
MSLWGNRDSKTASGTVAITSGGAVTGTSTAFTTQARIGNYIRVAGEDYEIVYITDNTHATVIPGVNGAAMTAVSPAAAYTLSEKPAYVAHEGRSPFGTAGDLGDSTKVYGVTTTELTAGGDNVVEVAVANGGTGYLEVPTVTIDDPTSGVTALATATIANGSVTRIAVGTVGSGYTTTPAANIDAPRITIDTANVNTSSETITYNGHGLSNGEAVKYYDGGQTTMGGLTNATTYYVGQKSTNTFKLYSTAAYGATAVATLTITTANVNITDNIITANGHGLVNGARLTYNNASGTSITGLTSGNDYYVVNKTTNTFQLALTAGGDPIDISGTGNSSQTFASTGIINITGTGNITQYFNKIAKVTATAVASLGESAVGGGAHAGWVRRIVGTGGRAGRVNYETLVAMGSVSGDQSDDIQYPDA